MGVEGSFSDVPVLLKGGVAVDDRGSLSFVNDFNFRYVKRFYVVENHQQGFTRAWHGHKKEGKYVLCVQGSALVCAVQILPILDCVYSEWDRPDGSIQPSRFVLSEKSPAVLWIPPGYVNGFKSLTGDMKLMFFSTSTLEESKGDDYRFPPEMFQNPWRIEER